MNGLKIHRLKISHYFISGSIINSHSSHPGTEALVLAMA